MDRLENLLTRLWLDIFGDTCSNPKGVVGRPRAPYPMGVIGRPRAPYPVDVIGRPSKFAAL